MSSELTPEEAVFAATLLDQHSEEFSNHGCNDCPIPNTDENWAMVERMGAWNIKGTVEEWRKSHDAEERPTGDTINVMDWYLSAYLAAKLRGECK